MEIYKRKPNNSRPFYSYIFTQANRHLPHIPFQTGSSPIYVVIIIGIKKVITSCAIT